MSWHPPIADLAEFGRLHDDCKAEVIHLANAMQAVDAAPKTTAALRAQACRLDRSYGSLRDLYYGATLRGGGFRDGWKTGGWRALVNKAKYQPVSRALSSSFVDFWKELRLQFQRDQTGKAAHDDLCTRLRNWERDPQNETLRIPGYDTPPPRDAFSNLPWGWTYANLMNYKPKALEAAAMRRGRNAALAFRAPILTSRVGLKVGQFVQYDDQEYDEFVNFLGVNRELQRVLGLDAIDVASASYSSHAFLPITYDPKKQQRIKLKAFHGEWFVAHNLMTFGYRTDTGSVQIIEHGTMTVSDPFQDQVARATGSKVTFATSDIIDNKAYAGMFSGKGGGSFKMKALLEGARVAHRNRASALPAPTGLDPDHAREETYYGLQTANNRTLRLMEKLPPHRASLLAHVAVEFHTFVGLALEIYDLLEETPDHELEGWIGNGWVVTEWRHALESQDWHAMEELEAITDEMVRTGMKALLTARPGLIQTRNLSRREVRLRHQGELTLVRGAAVPIMLGRDAARPARVGKEEPLFTIEADEYFPQPIHFLAQLKESRQMLGRGEEYLLYVDPFGCRRAEVCDLEGRWLGGVELWDRPCLSDTEALGRQFGLAEAAFNAEIRANVPRWAVPTTQARTAIYEHNTAVARGEVQTAKERAFKRGPVAGAEDFADAAPEPALAVDEVAAAEDFA